MRGLAALGVLTTHVALSAGQVGIGDVPGNGFAGVMLHQLHVSLPIFFVLSGVLLYRPFVAATVAGSQGPKLRPYLWRRLLRTMPAYWLLVVVTLVLLNRDAVNTLWEIVRPMLLLHIYQENARVIGMEQTWSLATEVAFYALLPLMAWLMHLFARRVTDPVRRSRRILACLLVPMIVGVAYTVYVHGPAFEPWAIQQEWPFKWFGYVAIGMALATLSVTAEAVPDRVPAPYRLLMRRPGLAWVAAAGVYLAACFSPFGEPGYANYPAVPQAVTEHVLYLLFGLLALAPLTMPKESPRFMVAFLSNPVMTYLGRISYGVYLWHIAIIYFYGGGLMQAGGFIELMSVVLVGSVLAASVSYFLVEMPAMRLRERLGKATVKPSVEVIER
ncbi:acyltransferase family protein [Nocardiopsis quinghaiensis]|uniref:acyltransferase family protein n=1 Tax=Nocardiopsis quinghaiensis TaxID=464995 RepID=UPI00123B7D48